MFETSICKYHHSIMNYFLFTDCLNISLQVTRCLHYTFYKINAYQTKIVHSRPKIRNLQHVNKDLFGMCTTTLRFTYY